LFHGGSRSLSTSHPGQTSLGATAVKKSFCFFFFRKRRILSYLLSTLFRNVIRIPSAGRMVTRTFGVGTNP
jgi:hypothetical protein